MLHKRCFMGLLLAAVLALPQFTWAGAVIKTEVLTPASEIRVGRYITIRVSVASNDTVPVSSVRLRVLYDSNSLNVNLGSSLLGVVNPDQASIQDLGSVSADAATLLSGTTYYRDFSTTFTPIPSAPITNMTPRCFLFQAQLKTTSLPSNFAITLTDPATGIPVKGTDDSSIAHTFDNSATSAIVPARVVATEWVSQTPIVPNGTFTVRVNVQSNYTSTSPSSLPTSCSLAVCYDSAAVAWVSVAAGNLGAPTAAAEQTATGTLRYRVVSCVNAGNANYIPACFTVTFRANNITPVPPFAIWVADYTNGLGRTGPTVLSHYIDNSRTRFTPVYSTELVTPVDQIRVGSDFRVRVNVSNNDTGYIPCSAFLQLNYPTAYLTMNTPDSTWEEGQGPVHNAGSAGAYQVYSDGYKPELKYAYTNANPKCFNASFRLTAPPPGPFNIALSDVTSWSPQNVGGMMEKDQLLPVAHVLNSVATTGITVNRVVVSEVMSGDKIAVGQTFRVRVKIASSDTSTSAGACAFRAQYDENALTLVEATAGDLGLPTVGSKTGTGTVTNDITTAGVFPGTSYLPTCFIAVFQVNSPAVTPFSISFSDQPISVTLAKGNDPATNLSHIFDNSLTQNLVLTPVVSTELIGTNVAGQSLRVRVGVSTNDASSIPVAALFRVNYTRTLEYTGLTSGVLGPVYGGPETTSGTTVVYRRIGTTGNNLNTDATPICYSVTFKSRPYPGRPQFVTLEDPSSGTPLLEKDTFVNIPHVFDNSATLSFPDPLPAIITTQWERADGIVPGRTVRINVKVAQNDWATTPSACCIRLYYNPSSITYTSATAGDLGAVSAVPGSDGGGSFVSITAGPNASANSLLPTCFTAVFTVAASPATPFTVWAADGSTGTPLAVLNDLGNNIPHTYTFTDTQDLVITPPTEVQDWRMMQ